MDDSREQQGADNEDVLPHTDGEYGGLDPDVQPEQELSDEALASEGPSDASERFREELERKAQEVIEAQNKYLRTYADFENYRKRMQRDMAEFRKYANEQLALDLLGVADHLGLAVKHAAESEGANKGVVEGVELVLKQLQNILEKYNVKPFRSEREPFNPAMHDAMMQVERDDLPENTVAQVFQEGYLYHDKVLRHAKVSVSKRPAETAAACQEPAAENAAPKDDVVVDEEIDETED